MNKYVTEMPEGEEKVDTNASNPTPAQNPASSSSMKATLQVGQRHWITVLVASRGDWDYDSNALWLSKTICRILRHKAHLREFDGAVEWKTLRLEYNRVEPTMDISDWSTDEWIENFGARKF